MLRIIDMAARLLGMHDNNRVPERPNHRPGPRTASVEEGRERLKLVQDEIRAKRTARMEERERRRAQVRAMEDMDPTPPRAA